MEVRDVIFRGKSIDTGRFIYGSLLSVNGKKYIYEGDYAELEEYFQFGFEQVIPETVGQYTGAKDKNGKKIFEGDLVKLSDWQPHEVVYFESLKTCTFYLKDTYFYINGVESEYMLIVGNIHNFTKHCFDWRKT